MNDARTEIYARIRGTATGASRQDIDSALHGLGSGPSAPLPSIEPCAAFLANVLLQGGSISTARSRKATVQAVAKYLFERHRTHKIAAGHDQRLAALPWRDAGLLPRFGAAGSNDAVSVSFAAAAVVETGSVILLTGKANPAANHLLVEDHIVLVDCEALLSTLDDATEWVGNLRHRPRGIQLISGPSSTADIGMPLVSGAHGPKRWHIILTGEIPAEAEEEARELAGLT